MKRWHKEVTHMERQRQLDLAQHRRHAIRWGKGPDDFECLCKEAVGVFRKKKEFSCSCYRCRAMTDMRRIVNKALRRRLNQSLATGDWDKPKREMESSRYRT